jgi:DNA-binding transcriptional LysR family regulator
MQSLIEGTVDIGVMYTPTSRPGLIVEPLFDETLLLVTSDLKRGWPDEGYIHIDWGPEFHAQFSDHHPETGPPALVANIGWLGVQQLLTYGGSGYFPQRLVRRYIEAGLLWRVPHTPQFKLPAWMVFPRDSESSPLIRALDGLRTLAREEQLRT